MVTQVLTITTCPSCGSKKIKKVRQRFTGEHRGAKYIVPSLELFACPDCGEKIFDRQAMREIEAHSPAFPGARPRRKSA